MEEDQEEAEDEEEEGQLNINDKSKEASGEVESPDQLQAAAGATDDTAGSTAGKGRSYECVFCKRGFSTAQALGGHMNIHRKDRARVTKGASASASASARRGAAEDVGEAKYRHYHPYSTLHRLRSSSSSFSSPVPVFSNHPNNSYLSQDQCSTDSTANRSYNTEARSSVEEDPRAVRRPSELSLFGDEDLGLHRDGDHHDGKHIKDGLDQEEKELDLELRLGHDDPR